MKVKKVQQYKVIGIMSGTSLDGVDIAYCEFTLARSKWSFSILQAKTFAYSKEWKSKLASAHTLPGERLQSLHAEYGRLLGRLCNQFITQRKIIAIDAIASHGHTIFHQPKKGFTFQLGDGNAIHSITRLPVIYDFRSLDVALRGEGAPLVPVGDQLLFADADICLNLGGIANLSTDVRGVRKAFDVCFCNMMLNHLSAKANKEFDKDGLLGRTGSIQRALLQSFEKIYRKQKKYPSLGREGFENEFQSLLDDESISIKDRLRTTCESIADEIVHAIPTAKGKRKLLITGGGALNSFLVELIESKSGGGLEVIKPSTTIINFKEALVFAFLGVLRLRGEVNVLKSVTGAPRDSCSGVLIG